MVEAVRAMVSPSWTGPPFAATGAGGVGLMRTVAVFTPEDVHPSAVVTTTFRVTSAPLTVGRKVTALVPLPETIVPPVIDQEYLAYFPASGTDALASKLPWHALVAMVMAAEGGEQAGGRKDQRSLNNSDSTDVEL